MKVFIFCYSPFVSSLTLSPCARWNKTGITVAGSGGRGSSPDQLDTPQGIFIHKEANILYVADSNNKRIQRFLLDQLPSDGITVISTETDPRKIFVDNDAVDGTTIYVSLPLSCRVEKWVENALSGIRVGDDCFNYIGVSVDKEKNVYMIDFNGSCVWKWSPRSNMAAVIAGRKGQFGRTNELLRSPEGIYVDQKTGSLYLADSQNHRIQKWTKDSKNVITVAGPTDGEQGKMSTRFSYPKGVFIDEQTHVTYVADTFNSRIQRWLPDALEGDTIVGAKYSGTAADQLNQPGDLAFDSGGNLYACDRNNHRIQMFKIINNYPCPTIAPANTDTTSSTMITTTITTMITTITTTTTITMITKTTTMTTTIQSGAVRLDYYRYTVATLSMIIILSKH